MSLDGVFKAYDIRGVYPDEIDEALARRIGNAFAHFTGAQHLVVGHDMRAVVGAARRRVHRGRDARGRRRHRRRPGVDRPRVLRVRAARRARRDAHREPQSRAVQRHQAVPGRRRAGRRADRAAADQGDGRVGRDLARRGRRARSSSVDLLEAFGAHVRSFVDASALKPLKVVADTANGMGGLVVPQVFEGSAVLADRPLRRARRHVPEPPRRPDPAREPEGSAARGARPRAPTSASRSTATPTACSSSTTRACRSAARPRPRSSRPASSTVIPARPSCTTSSARTRCPRSSASTAARRCARGSATRSSSRSWPRPARSSAASTRRTTTSATTGAPTPVRSRRCWCSSSSAGPGMPLSELRKPFERYVQSGEINSRVDDPLAVIEAVAAEYAGCVAGPARRPDRRLRRVVVQPAAEQHRAAAAPEPRGARRGAVRGAHRRGAGAHPAG